MLAHKHHVLKEVFEIINLDKLPFPILNIEYWKVGLRTYLIKNQLCFYIRWSVTQIITILLWRLSNNWLVFVFVCVASKHLSLESLTIAICINIKKFIMELLDQGIIHFIAMLVSLKATEKIIKRPGLDRCVIFIDSGDTITVGEGFQAIEY